MVFVHALYIYIQTAPRVLHFSAFHLIRIHATFCIFLLSGSTFFLKLMHMDLKIFVACVFLSVANHSIGLYTIMYTNRNMGIYCMYLLHNKVYKLAYMYIHSHSS